jgi:hypothetical protein
VGPVGGADLARQHASQNGTPCLAVLNHHPPTMQVERLAVIQAACIDMVAGPPPAQGPPLTLFRHAAAGFRWGGWGLVGGGWGGGGWGGRFVGANTAQEGG